MNPYFCSVAIILYFCSVFQVFNGNHTVSNSILRQPGAISTEALGSILTLTSKSSPDGSVSSLHWQDYEFFNSVHDMGNKLMISSTNTSIRLSSFLPEENSVEKFIEINPFGENELNNVVRFEINAHQASNVKNPRFVALAGYLPDSFTRILEINLTSGVAKETTLKEANSSAPLIVSTSDGKHAMGIVSDDQFSPNPQTKNTFTMSHSMLKWTTALDAPSDSKGNYAAHNFLIVGNLSDVEHTMVQLNARRIWNSVALAN